VLHVSVVRPSSSKNILLARITQLTTDPLFLEYSQHYGDRLITCCLVDVVAVMGDVVILVYNFHVRLVLKVGCPSSGVCCDIALVFIFMCVGLMAICNS
jgi:hypothetical protein